MKNLIRYAKMALVVIVAGFLVNGCDLMPPKVCWGDEYFDLSGITDDEVVEITDQTGTDNIADFSAAVATSFFLEVDDKMHFEVSWSENGIDIKYGEGVKVSDAAKEFFDYLKQYINQGYKIVPR